MKRNYSTPKAEKVEFDYTETVVASRWPWCNPGGGGGMNNPNPTDPPQGQPKYNNDPNGQYFKCLATYYYNC